MEKIGNNDKKIETKKQAPSIRVNKLYSICSAAYMFAAVVIMFGAGIGGIEFPSWVKQAGIYDSCTMDSNGDKDRKP